MPPSPSCATAASASGADAVVDEADRPPDHIGDRRRDRRQRHFRHALALRPLEMRKQRHLRAAVGQAPGSSARRARSASRRSPRRPGPARSGRRAAARACPSDRRRRRGCGTASVHGVAFRSQPLIIRGSAVDRAGRAWRSDGAEVPPCRSNPQSRPGSTRPSAGCEAQRACLDWAVARNRRDFRACPGAWLGNGRSYDHLRKRLPEREIYRLRAQRAGASGLYPARRFPDPRQPRGDACLRRSERFAGKVAFLHSDIGTGDDERNAAFAAWLGPEHHAICLRPAAIVASDQTARGARGIGRKSLPEGRRGRALLSSIAADRQTHP